MEVDFFVSSKWSIISVGVTSSFISFTMLSAFSRAVTDLVMRPCGIFFKFICFCVKWTIIWSGRGARNFRGGFLIRKGVKEFSVMAFQP